MYLRMYVGYVVLYAVGNALITTQYLTFINCLHESKIQLDTVHQN